MSREHLSVQIITKKRGLLASARVAAKGKLLLQIASVIFHLQRNGRSIHSQLVEQRRCRVLPGTQMRQLVPATVPYTKKIKTTIRQFLFYVKC